MLRTQAVAVGDVDDILQQLDKQKVSLSLFRFFKFSGLLLIFRLTLQKVLETQEELIEIFIAKMTTVLSV